MSDTKKEQRVKDLFDFYYDDGTAKGEAKGRAEGFTEGKAEGRVETTLHYVRHIMTTLGYGFEEALDLLGVTGELREKCKEQADSASN